MSEIVKVIYDLDPGIDGEYFKTHLSRIMSMYHVKDVDLEETHPDLFEKIDLFISSKKVEGLSINTLDGYGLELKKFAEKVKKKTIDITTADVRVFLAGLTDVKMSTVGKKLSVLKSFFGWLASEEIIPKDPTAKMKPMKLEKLMPKALSIEELEMLRESCETIRQRAFIEILYATGCRLSEIQRLNRSDINHQAMSCRVIGKGNKEREVYFSFKAMYHLNKYLDQRKDDCEALMITERKEYRRLSKRGIQREIKIIAKKAGLENKVSPHVLRHTFATLTLNNGAELVAIQELLGHSSPETTLRYAKITEERKREQHKKYLVL